MEPIKSANKNGYRLKIFQDEIPENPRNWDNLGTMVCFGKHGLGDKHEYERAYDFLLDLFDEIPEDQRKTKSYSGHAFKNVLGHVENCGEYIMLPLYLYDHSGLKMRTYPYPCPWDSGQVGWIYVSREKLKKEGLESKTDAEITQSLISEVKTYNQYLSGDVYGYVLERLETCPYCKHVENVHVDSCWGLFGLDGLKEQILGYLGSEFGELVEALA